MDIIDREHVYEEARRAYRFLFELEESIRSVALYIQDEIDCKSAAGVQLFSNKIETTKPKVGSWAGDKFSSYKWGWDFFPTYMYAYCYKLNVPNCYFSMVSIMDDGAKNLESKICPNPEISGAFFDVEKSESYFMFYISQGSVKLNKNEIFAISNVITDTTIFPYKYGRGKDEFFVWKVAMSQIACKQDIDAVLTDCDNYASNNLNFKLRKLL